MPGYQQAPPDNHCLLHCDVMTAQNLEKHAQQMCCCRTQLVYPQKEIVHLQIILVTSIIRGSITQHGFWQNFKVNTTVTHTNCLLGVLVEISWSILDVQQQKLPGPAYPFITTNIKHTLYLNLKNK